MPNTATPYGLRPVNSHGSGGGAARLTSRTINPSYTTKIFKGDLVILHTDGTVRVATAGGAVLGVMMGCTYVDSAGRPNVSPHWTGEASATEIKALICEDPDQVYRIQADAAMEQADIGQCSDIVTGTSGSDRTGQSGQALDADVENASSDATLRVIGLVPDPGNSFDDTYPDVLVTIHEHQFSGVAGSGV